MESGGEHNESSDPQRGQTARQSIVLAVAVTPDGTQACSSDNRGIVRVWDLATCKERVAFSVDCAPLWARAQDMDRGWSVRTILLTADGSQALGGCEDGTVRVWDPATSREQARLDSLGGSISSIALAANETCLISGDIDRVVRVWNLKTGRQQARLRGHESLVTSVAASADGSRVVSGGTEGTVLDWDVTTRQLRATLSGHIGWVWSVAVTADGSCAVSGGDDGTVRVWDLATSRQQAMLTGHGGIVHAVAVTPDGSCAVSGGDDGTVRVWDLATSRQQATLTGRRTPVEAVQFDSKWHSVRSITSVPIPLQDVHRNIAPPEEECPECDMWVEHEPGCPYEGLSMAEAKRRYNTKGQ
jgi:WD40 repeat protein